MNEYYNSLEQTEEAIKVIDGLRWLKTGDLGYVTATGGLVISGRLKRIYWTIMDDGVAYRVYPMKTETGNTCTCKCEKLSWRWREG